MPLRIIFAVLALASSLAAQGSKPAAQSAQSELPDAPEFHMLDLLRLHPAALPSISAVAPQDFSMLDGTHLKLTLAGTVSSKQASGTPFEARLVDAVVLKGETILPASTKFQGHVETLHSRRMMRHGALYLVFDDVVLPSGERYSVHAYLQSAESAHIKRDAEGRLRPEWTHKRQIIEIGATALVGKFADDIAESAASGTIGAGSARYVGLGASTMFLMLQKGPDAQLRPGTKIEVEFGRPTATPLSAAPGNTLKLTEHTQ